MNRPPTQTAIRRATQVVGCVAAVMAVDAVNVALSLPGPLLRPAFMFLCLILLAAAFWGLRWAVFLSLLATLGFSWLLPPLGSLKWHDWREAYALAAFLIVALTADRLSRRARAEARRAIQSERELRAVLHAAPAHLWRSSPSGAVEFVNEGWQRYTGLPVERATGWKWENSIHPDDRDRFVSGWRDALARCQPMESEVRVRRADGQYRWWFVRNIPHQDEKGTVVQWFGGGFEIEDRKRAEALLSRENQILEMVAQGGSLPEILRPLCLLVEESVSGALASILLLQAGRLWHGAAPSLPEEYTAAINGAPIGPSAGSCGTAAYRREPVIVEDIATDPLWADYRALALSHSLRACWSTPVFSSKGELIATFALYYRQPRRPDGAEQEVIRHIAHLAGIAIERKLTQEALRMSEAYLAEAQRVAHLGTWVWQVQDREAVYVSDEWYRIYGFDRNQGPPAWQQRLERVHAEDRERYKSAVEQAIAENSDYDVEFRIVLPAGMTKYLHVIGHPVRDDSGKLVKYVGIATDITQQKQTEMALRAAMEERARISAFREEIGIALSQQVELKEILHSCASAMVGHLDAAFARIWTLSSDGRELELQASAGMYTHLDGVHRRIPVGQYKIGLIAQEQKPHFTNDAQCDSGISDTTWAREEKIVSFAGYPLLLADRVVGVMGMFSRKPLAESTLDALSFAAGIVAQGIERKRAEEALRRSEAYLAEGQRLTHVGSWAVDVATRQALHSSAEHTRLFGFDPKMGTPSFNQFLERIHPEDQARVLEVFQGLAVDGGDLDFEYRVAVPDGSVRYLHAVGHPALGQSGTRGEYVGITIDITERRRSDQERERLHQLEADLAHMNRVTTMGELTASLAHEVNQPITAAMTSARTCIRWLTRDLPNIERALAAAARIVSVTERAAEIISRIRVQFRKGSAERQSVDMNEIVCDCIALLRNEAARHNIIVRTELDPDLPAIRADRIQLQQVLMNLMINGIEAMKEMGGRRELAFHSQRETGDRVLISVRDTGIGLPPQADELFTPFFTTKAEGTGMGLAISRSIIESHGGRLWATPHAGGGASFHFTLSIADEEKADPGTVPASWPA